ncbi:MAG: hypothetical protein QM803_15055 [Rhodocyclaceae bacterium]
MRAIAITGRSALRFVRASAMTLVVLAAPTQAAPNAPRADDLQTVVDGMGCVDLFMYAMARLEANPDSGATVTMAARWMQGLPRERVSAAFVDELGREATPQESAQLAEFLRTPAGQRAGQYVRASVLNPAAAKAILLAQDMPVIAAFSSTPGGRLIDEQRMGKVTKAVIDSLGRSFNAQLLQANKVLADRVRRMTETPNDMRLSTDTTGLESVPPEYRDLMLAMAGFIQRSTIIQTRYSAAVEASPIDKWLSASSLATTEGVAEARRQLARLGASLTERDQQLFANVEASTKNLAQHLPASAMSTIQQRLADSLDLQLRFSENQRRVQQIIGRMLDLAEANLGRTHATGGLLTFDAPDQQEKYRTLAVELKREADLEGEISQQSAAAIERGISRLSGN